MKKAVRTRHGVPTRTAADWEEATLDVIAARGLASVSIPALAHTLGVTKGSFYWHFGGLEDLITHSVKRWEAKDKAALDQLREIQDPGDRLRVLFAESMSAERASALYLALAASTNPRVAQSLLKVSERRLTLLIEGYRQLGMTVAAARQQALLTYSAYIGGVHLRNSNVPWLHTAAEVRDYVDHAGRVLVASARPKRR